MLNPATSTQDDIYQLCISHYLVKFLMPCKMSPVLPNPMEKKERYRKYNIKSGFSSMGNKDCPHNVLSARKVLTNSSLKYFVYYCIQKEASKIVFKK